MKIPSARHALVRATFAAAALAAAFVPPASLAAGWAVDPEVGNSTMTAVFDAALGERITAQSSQVGCELSWDPGTGLASGLCRVPLASVKVDAEETKTEHFQQWTTNKKSDPAACAFEARFEGVRLGALPPGEPTAFAAEVPFTVCGRGPADGRRERLAGTALRFAAGEYGRSETIRVRATIERFDREAYRIGPAFTDGWLARVQSLAKVVAREGRVDLTLFASARPASPAAAR